MSRGAWVGLAVAFLAAQFTAWPPPARAQQAGIIVYSGRREPLILPVIERFRQQTGLRVPVRSGAIGELANLALEERSRPRADGIIPNEVAVLEVLRRYGVSEPNPGAAVR